MRSLWGGLSLSLSVAMCLQAVGAQPQPGGAYDFTGVAQPLGELCSIEGVTSEEWTRVSLDSSHHSEQPVIMFCT
eukprot:COSAG03_NODE_20392_length_320_cov_0.683258_1_plen_74_part_01